MHIIVRQTKGNKGPGKNFFQKFARLKKIYYLSEKYADRKYSFTLK